MKLDILANIPSTLLTHTDTHTHNILANTRFVKVRVQIGKSLR